jgi:chromosomal replication initiation ATPase DnaA
VTTSYVSKLVPQEMARQLLEDYPSTAMEVALEITRLVHMGRVRITRHRPVKEHNDETEAARIVEAVCEHFGVERRWLCSAARARQLAGPRRVAWALIRRRLRWSYQQIGDMFDRDNTSVNQGLRKVRAEDVDAVCQRLDAAEAAE